MRFQAYAFLKCSDWRRVKALCTSYTVDRLMDEMVTATLATGWEHARAINRLMKRLEQHIACFPEHKHLAQYCGISWAKRSSGGFLPEHPHDQRRQSSWSLLLQILWG